jgi:hypothetical protein
MSGNQLPTYRDGKRISWQCGCRQNGGVQVKQWHPGDLDIDAAKDALLQIATIKGCECDDYHGHRCLMCKVRSIANQALGTR